VGLIVLTLIGWLVGLAIGPRKAFLITAGVWVIAALVSSILTFGLVPLALFGQRDSVVAFAAALLLSLVLTEASVGLHQPTRRSPRHGLPS
jgi:hypothetical protein